MTNLDSIVKSRNITLLTKVHIVKAMDFHSFFSGSYDFSLVAQTVKHLPEMQETWVRSLSQEDPLEKEMATYSSILAWRIPWTEELVGYSLSLSTTPPGRPSFTIFL